MIPRTACVTLSVSSVVAFAAEQHARYESSRDASVIIYCTLLVQRLDAVARVRAVAAIPNAAVGYEIRLATRHTFRARAMRIDNSFRKMARSSDRTEGRLCGRAIARLKNSDAY